jgi:hypothetical protein
MFSPAVLHELVDKPPDTSVIGIVETCALKTF